MDHESSSPTSHISGSFFFTPLLISMGGIMCTALMIIIYHLLSVRYCLRRRRQRTIRSFQRNPNNNGLMNSGVEQKVLETIPILPYSVNETELFRVDQSECVVCLGELEDGHNVRLLPNCRHAFHVKCVDEWFMAHRNCPVCRSPILDPVTLVLPMSLPFDDGDQENDGVEENQNQDGPIITNNSSTNNNNNNNGGIRPCLSSSVFPLAEERRRHLVMMNMKRSLSLDQFFVLINMEKEDERLASSALTNNTALNSKDGNSNIRLCRGGSLGQFDRVPSILLKPLSRLRSTGRSSSKFEVLPY